MSEQSPDYPSNAENHLTLLPGNKALENRKTDRLSTRLHKILFNTILRINFNYQSPKANQHKLKSPEFEKDGDIRCNQSLNRVTPSLTRTRMALQQSTQLKA